MNRFVLLAIPLLSFFGCTPKKQFAYDDPIHLKIAGFQDRRLTDSLTKFFKAADPAIRASAALAFASVQDTTAAPALGNLLLEDPDNDVRENAAFALGQCGGIAGVNALIPALQDTSRAVVRAALESLGKIIKKEDIHVLLEYRSSNSLTDEGLAWGLYRAGVRGLVDSLVIARETEFLNKRFSHSTRLAAAYFFSRAQLKGNHFETVLIGIAISDSSADIRMSAASGLRKLKSERALNALRQILTSDTNEGVRINATRALATYPPAESRALLLKMLNDTAVNVSIAASEVIGTVMKTPWPEAVVLARQKSNWRVQANLYKAILKTDSTLSHIPDVKNTYASSTNDYQKAWLLAALGNNPEEYNFVGNALLNSNVPVIRSSAAAALVAMNYSMRFNAGMTPAFARLYERAILKGDPAVVGTICAALADSLLGYRNQFKSIDFLRKADERMRLPQDLESKQPVAEAIAFLEKRPKPPALRNTWNHPIDWKTVAYASEHDHATILTSKGIISIRLFTEDAPGSVVNFIALAKSGYYTGKFFHRTVPNFVVQAGCNRGDGFGSEDYSIRSEFSKRQFGTGAIGMASAGKDTEGTQWFITNSPTPHLDGRYTVFGCVENGMHVVNRLEVGDTITDVTID